MFKVNKWLFLKLGLLLIIPLAALGFFFYKSSLPYEIIFPKAYEDYIDQSLEGNSYAFNDTILKDFVLKLGLEGLINAEEFTTLPDKSFGELSRNVDLIVYEKDIITSLIKDTVNEMSQLYPDEPKKYFYVLPGKFYQHGSFGGCALSENLFFLFIEESISAAGSRDKLRSTIVHEYTHTCDPDMLKENLILGNLAVMEGKAQYSSAVMVDAEREALDENVAYLSKDMIFDMMKLQWEYYDSPSAYEHYQTAEFYAYGYRVVRDYAKNHPELSLPQVVETDYKTILNEFEESWL